jgi:DNA-binding GntR family transcriptional regulator
VIVLNPRLWQSIATATLTVNAGAMALAYTAHENLIFGLALTGGAFSGLARIFFIEEARDMGQNWMGYRSLAMRLRWEIKEEGYQPGDLLPTHREYAERFGTTRVTVRRALAILAEENIVEIVKGKGTFVLGPHGERGNRPQDWVEDTILTWLVHRRRLDNAETLAHTMAVSTSTTRRVLRRLIEQGHIKRLPDGSYVEA